MKTGGDEIPDSEQENGRGDDGTDVTEPFSWKWPGQLQCCSKKGREKNDAEEDPIEFRF